MQSPALPARWSSNAAWCRPTPLANYRAGPDDGLIPEVIANVALNTLTNYTTIADTTVDFPVVAILISIGI